MDFKETIALSRRAETERLFRPLSTLMPDEYQLDNTLRHQIISGSYRFPDARATGTDKRVLTRTQARFSAKVHVPSTPLYFHRHDFIELLYMYRGHCKQYLENLSTCIALNEGDVFLLNSAVIHGLLQEDDCSILIKIIVPKELLGHEFVQRLQGQQAEFWTDALSPRQEYNHCLHYSDCTGNERLFVERMIEGYYSQDPYREDSNRCWLQLLLIALEHRKGVCRRQRLTHSTMEIGRISQYIYEHSENVTLEDLANFFSYSPSYLSRAIKEGCGMTFLELLRECRLEKAVVFLTSSRLSIEQIAEKVGYKSSASLYNGIKEKFGISPGEYRRKHSRFDGPHTTNE